MTVFAGRRRYLSILVVYIERLLEAGVVDECHLWDFTRSMPDSKYVNALANASGADPRLQVRSVRDKSEWTEYYDRDFGALHGEDAIIVKCDDDVVAIDIAEFAGFVKCRVDNPDVLLMFPCIWNNGFCMHLLQNERRHSALAGAPFSFERNFEGFERIVGDGAMGSYAHETFLRLREGGCPVSSSVGEDVTHVPTNQRVSINMFAVMARDWKHFAGICDDEKMLTQVLPGQLGRNCAIYWPMSVAHFAFGPQRATGLGDEVEKVLLARYDALASSTCSSKKTRSNHP